MIGILIKGDGVFSTGTIRSAFHKYMEQKGDFQRGYVMTYADRETAVEDMCNAWDEIKESHATSKDDGLNYTKEALYFDAAMAKIVQY